MRDALARHDAILRDAVEQHGGRIVKTTGDGALAVLGAVQDAVGAAATALRTLSSQPWGPTGSLPVRVGIHTGSAEERDGDYFGPSLNRANRLMAAAHGGQVVLSSASAADVRDVLPDGLELVDLGEHRLRGLARPERVYQLAIAGLPSEFPPLQSLDAFPGPLPLPGPSFAHGDEELAGRGVELQHLERLWQRAADGARHVALLAGEPGIGKTRLVGELSNEVHAQRGAVLYGRCDEESIVPYQPFVEALRPYVTAYPPSALRERMRGLEQDLTRIFPQLLGRLPDRSPPTVSDPEAERYRLFEAITALLTGIAAPSSALLVLDDLHWADKPTLLLLRHVVRSASGAPLLVVACYRDVELPREHPTADLIGDLRREPFVEHMTLRGLSEDESRVLLRSLAGSEVTPTLADALHRETAGNPFFLEELIRGLMETEGLRVSQTGDARELDVATLDLPAGIRDAVARRLRRLPETVNEVLSAAAVVGHEFDASLLGRAGEWPPAYVLQALDQAKGAGLLDERPERLGRYAFSHALIRQSVYTELGTGRRAHLHARVGTAMEQEAGLERTAAELAQHFARAVPVGEATKAIEYAAAAGRDAAADLAFEDAVVFFERALRLLDEHAPDDPASRIDLLTDRANALLFVDEADGVKAALQAVEAARADGTPTQFGCAVAVFTEPVSAALAHPHQVARLFDEARAALGDDSPALRARLLALEAFKHAAYQLSGRDARALAHEAVELARRAEEPLTLAEALFALAVSLEGSAAVAQRSALGEELVGLGRTAAGRAATATAYGLRVLAGVHLEVGDADRLTETITELARLGDELRWLPALAAAAQWRATQALLGARFEDVHAAWKEMRRFARAYRGVAGMQAQQFYYLARERGQLADLVGSLQQVTAERPDGLYVPAMLAVAQLEAGDEAAARSTLDALVARDLRRGERESAWGAVLGLLAEVAVETGSSHAPALYEHLAPFRGRLLAATIGLACLGAADRYLGMLSATLRHWDAAEEHFERALAVEERIRGRALSPRTRYWQARFLRARGGPGDDDAAGVILDRVVEETDRLGMPRVHEQAERLRAR